MKATITSILSLAVISTALAQAPKTAGTQTKKPATTTKPTAATKPATSTVATSKPLPPIDRTKAPAPGPAPKIQIGSYQTFQLPNGLKVFVVNNNKLPRVTASLNINNDLYHEGDKAGVAEMTGQMLTKGTDQFTKQEFDEQIEFLGASINSGRDNVTASFLSKHTDKVLAMMVDVIMNPSFNQDEFDKLKKQTLQSIKSSKADANSIARNVSKVMRYGKGHPYGNIVTEASIKNITLNDCKNYYRQFYSPSNAYLVLVGDITIEGCKNSIAGMLEGWNGPKLSNENFTAPPAPKFPTVVLVNKPGAVQSVINITYPVQFSQTSKDFFPGIVMNEMLGGGIFGSRLNQNLREGHGYTYGAGSRLGSDPNVGYFTAQASVRTEVTDSALDQFFIELNNIRNNKPDDSLVRKIKTYMTGSFARNLESPSTIAAFAYNTARYGLPENYYQNYLKTLNEVNAMDIQAAAQKYILPENSYIVVVGNKDALLEKLKRFGKVMVVDVNGDPIKDAPTLPTMTPQQLGEKYLKAIGGADKMKALKNQTFEYEGEVREQVMTIIIKRMAPNLMRTSQYMGEMGEMGGSYFNGKKGYNKQMGNRVDMTPEEVEFMAGTNQFDFVWNFANYGFTAKAEGSELINGKAAYKVVYTKNNKSLTNFYDAETGLLVRTVTTRSSQRGEMTITITYSDYNLQDGYMVAKKIVQAFGPFEMEMTLKSAKFNTNMKAGEFE